MDKVYQEARMSGRKKLRGSNPGGNNSEDSPRRNNKLVKKGKAPQNDDDDSVDSRGNIRGLIAYSDEEDESEFSV